MVIKFINSITFGQLLPGTCKLEDTDIQQSITMDLFWLLVDQESEYLNLSFNKRKEYFKHANRDMESEW